MELSRFFKQYEQALSALDTDAVAAMFTLPFTTYHHGEGTCWSDRESLFDTTFGLLEWYRSQGFVSAALDVKQLLPMGPDFASAIVHWTITRNQGGPWEYHTGYHLKRELGIWRIYCVVQFDDRPVALGEN